MYRHLVAMTFGVVMSLAGLTISPAVAQDTAVQADDKAYCNNLARRYLRYMPERSYGSSMGASPSTETSVALTMCNDGRAADAIPLLEKALRNAAFGVPDRAIGARGQ